MSNIVGIYQRMNKAELHQHCIELLKRKEAELKLAISDAQEAVNSDSKSSAGDKHETGREMVRQEVDKLGVQLVQAERSLDMAQKVAQTKHKNGISLGSLIYTNHGIFYLLVALGRITINQEEVFVISSDSPLGKQLMMKKENNQFSFLDKNYMIENYD